MITEVCKGEGAYRDRMNTDFYQLMVINLSPDSSLCCLKGLIKCFAALKGKV